MARAADILLITVNAHETSALRAAFEQTTGYKAEGESRDNRIYHRLGSLGGVNFFHALSQMGSEPPGAMRETVAKAIEALNPGAVIAVGIAFGTVQGKQQIGDVLISKQLHCSEPQRLGREAISRGDTVTASTQLLNYFQGFAQHGWNQCPVKVGLVLSSEKLIDDKAFRDQLLKAFPEAIGGEMEGAGLYYACRDHNVQWIVIKAICDWADGNKAENKTSNQKLAAKNVAQFLVHCLQQTPLLIERDGPVPQEVPSRLRSNVQGLRHQFIGRDVLLQQIGRELGSAPGKNVLVLHGVPGVGKSELAREVARRLQRRYPGGTFEIDFKLGPEVPLAEIGRKNLALQFAPDLKPADQAQYTLSALCASQALLIYDNVVNQETLTAWLPPHGAQCHVLITSFLEQWEGWWALEVEPLSQRDSVKLVENLAGAQIAGQLGKQLAKTAGGLPVELCPAAKALAAEFRRWKQLPQLPSTLARESEQSFQRAYQILETEAQVLLQGIAFLESQRAPLKEIVDQFQQALQWDEAKVRHLADSCIDLHLLEGGEELRMHQTVASFFARTTPSPEQKALLAKIRQVQVRRLVEIAGQVEANPVRADLAAILLLLPLTPEQWEKHTTKVSIADGETIGRALYEIGRFDQARPWFERAVKEIEQGDAQGCVDHDSLGKSLHRAAYCLSQARNYAEAQTWLKRAVEEKEKGDLHGRVDHDSLGRSLYSIGSCLSATGHYAEARPWCERAVEEEEQGDVHGWVDHQELGKSLHQVGYCLAQTGKYAEARPWYERAVKEIEQGDAHRRVDHDVLGRSLYSIGSCLSATGHYAEARPWYERAVKEEEQGDVHGRVDHQELGKSLNQVGYCLSQTGDYAEARPWFERAVKEKEQGDVHGRVDQESLRTSIDWLRHCVLQLGQKDEAAKWAKRLQHDSQET